MVRLRRPSLMLIVLVRVYDQRLFLEAHIANTRSRGFCRDDAGQHGSGSHHQACLDELVALPPCNGVNGVNVLDGDMLKTALLEKMTGPEMIRLARLHLVGGHDPQLADRGVARAGDHVGHAIGDVLCLQDFGRFVEGIDAFAHHAGVVRSQLRRDTTGL